MFGAENYDEWYDAALELDCLEGRDLWRLDKECELYSGRYHAAQSAVIRHTETSDQSERVRLKRASKLPKLRCSSAWHIGSATSNCQASQRWH